VVTAQAWYIPEETCATLVSPVLVSTGVGVVTVPTAAGFPRAPQTFHPQQYATPEVVTAQVIMYPALIEATFVVVRPVVVSTGVGVERPVQVPSPRLPREL
jgi:hypothetical protein